MNGITSRCELSLLWSTLSKGELGKQRQQEGGGGGEGGGRHTRY